MSGEAFKPGARVRYRFGNRDTGTIVKACGPTIKFGDWWVRWDHDPHGPRLLSAFEENMDLLGAPRQEALLDTAPDALEPKR